MHNRVRYCELIVEVFAHHCALRLCACVSATRRLIHEFERIAPFPGESSEHCGELKRIVIALFHGGVDQVARLVWLVGRVTADEQAGAKRILCSCIAGAGALPQ